METGYIQFIHSIYNCEQLKYLPKYSQFEDEMVEV